MADYATKGEIKELFSEQTNRVEKLLSEQTKGVEKMLSEQTTVILNAVDERLGDMRSEMNEKFSEVNVRIDKLEDAIRELTLTMDEFMKRVIHQDEELAVLNAKVDKISAFLKQKFGVEISAQ